MADLFDGAARPAGDGPLADRMRPRSLDEIVGQQHIVAPGRLLWRSIRADRLSSILFYGPPGTGKTSIARVIANTTKSSFESLNAVLGGVKDIREAIARAEERKKLYGKRTILFVDEVHRWNKAQQDALLPWVENGMVVLIGATTENPFFEVNKALVSRSRIFQLLPLERDDLFAAVKRALADRERGYGRYRVSFEDGALEHLVDIANGDARSLLNALELAVETSVEPWPPADGAEIAISLDTAEESIQKKAVLYDRDGDYHFDTISAFIKSIRGSDPDAALYWLAKMLRAGEDPDFILRRLLISACEDIGLADPQGIVHTQACAAAFRQVGLPEGHFHLAQAVLYLATAPKSNSALAFFDAMKEVEKQDASVPSHLRDGSRDAEGFGHGEGYLYPHAFRDHWAAQQYLPGALAGRVFWVPGELGYEGAVREDVLRRRELQAALVLSGDEADGEILSWKAPDKGLEAWQRRSDSGRAAGLLEERRELFARAALARHHRVLVLKADDGLLLQEAWRQVPEGLAAGLVSSPAAQEALAAFARSSRAPLEDEELPHTLVAALSAVPEARTLEEAFGCPRFERILARNPLAGTAGDSQEALWKGLSALLEAGGRLVFSQLIPSKGQRLSSLEGMIAALDGESCEAFREAEEAFFTEGSGATGPTARGIAESLELAGLTISMDEKILCEKRRPSPADIARWFDTKSSSWGRTMARELGDERLERIRELLTALAGEGPLDWKRGILYVTAEKTT